MRTPTALRVTEHYLVLYRRIWRGSVVVSFVGPTLFLAAIGVGLGSIVDDVPGATSYLDWVAPGLLATAAMQTAAAETTYPVMMGKKWVRTYHSMLATPGASEGDESSMRGSSDSIRPPAEPSRPAAPARDLGVGRCV